MKQIKVLVQGTRNRFTHWWTYNMASWVKHFMVFTVILGIFYAGILFDRYRINPFLNELLLVERACIGGNVYTTVEKIFYFSIPSPKYVCRMQGSN